MSVTVHIIDGPLAAPEPWSADGAGAVLSFEGVVRPMENDVLIAALEYDVYHPMAEQQLQRLGDSIVDQHDLIGLIVEHSRGRVHVGECSFRLRIASAHRKEGLAAMDTFIDRMKRDVPIWKTPVGVESARAQSTMNESGGAGS